MRTTRNTQAATLLTITALALALLLRLKTYLDNRSLFLDEANLTRNILEGNYGDFFAPLRYEQYAPPGYLSVTKVCTQLFGTGEYTLRLFPLLSGLAACFLFYRILQKTTTNQWLRLTGMTLFAINPMLVRYASEVKQYGCDVLFTLLIVWAAAKDPIRHPRYRLPWLLAGVLLPWFSMPSVFLLGATGLFWLWQNPRTLHNFLRWATIIGGWLLSFGGYFFLILRHDIGSDYLQGFHQLYFLSVTDPVRSVDLIVDLLKQSVGYTAVAIGFAAVGVLAGGSRQPVVAGGIGLCLLASLAGYYTLIGRTVLFTIPLLLLVIVAGWDWLVQRFAWSIYLVGLILLHLISIDTAIGHLWQPLAFSETRPVLAQIADRNSERYPIRTNQWAQPIHWYYVERPGALFHKRLPPQHPLPKQADLLNSGPAWHVYAHLSTKETVRATQGRYVSLPDSLKINAPGTFAVLVSAPTKNGVKPDG